MTSIPITEAREHLADLGNRVALRGERVVVERRGKNLFALVPMEDMDLVLSPSRRTIVVNPQSPNIPSAVVK